MRYDDFSTLPTKNGDRLLRDGLDAGIQAFFAAWLAACRGGLIADRDEVAQIALQMMSGVEQLATLAGVKP